MAKIRGEMIENLRRRGGAESILLTSVDRPWTGKRLSEMADTWKIEPIDAAVRDSPRQCQRFDRLVQHDR
jgi:hypothetical protein